MVALIPALVSLRSEVNELAPDRNKESDGWIGDAAHQAEESDHNNDETGNVPVHDADHDEEVHAVDVDKDLNRPGWTMARVVAVIVGRHRSGEDDRLNYVIYDRKIAGAYNDWQWEPYFGANPHDKHAHFSGRYDTASERDTKSWGLLAADRGDDTMSVQDVRDYFTSAANAVTKDKPVTGQNRIDRDAVTSLLRFALGLEASQQTMPNLWLAQFNRVYGAIAGLDQVDEHAIADALLPGLVAAIEQRNPGGSLTGDDVKAALREVLTKGTDAR